MDKYKDTIQKLNKVGCGFCLAKWAQVTVHLHNGQNHSCHHPSTHKIDIEELKDNPTALHNTKFKKEIRKEMLENKRPAECVYCWNIEDHSTILSDRILKSAEPWAAPFYDTITKSAYDKDFNPKYVEVSFSNKCNFKCSYCSPAFSTRWTEEIDKHGGYPTSGQFNSLESSKDKIPYRHDEYNPYVEAFWKWWPELYYDLDTFRITGGEPLLSDDTWKILDFLIENKNPNPELKFSINSNFGVPDKLFDKFVEKIKIIEETEKAKQIIIYTSCDAWGAQAEYIRFGMEFDRFMNNVHKLLASTQKVTLIFMVAYNALSVSSFDKFIKNIYELKKTYHTPYRYWKDACCFDASYIRYPTHQSVRILPEEFKNKIYRQAELLFWIAKPFWGDGYIGATDMELRKMKRIHDWATSPLDQHTLNIDRKDFYKFFTEHDRRRGTDFVKTFPELEDFYNKCKEL